MPTTLQHSNFGLQTDRSQARIHCCALSIAQEVALVDYIPHMCAIGPPPTPYTINQAIVELLMDVRQPKPHFFQLSWASNW